MTWTCRRACGFRSPAGAHRRRIRPARSGRSTRPAKPEAGAERATVDKPYNAWNVIPTRVEAGEFDPRPNPTALQCWGAGAPRPASRAVGRRLVCRRRAALENCVPTRDRRSARSHGAALGVQHERLQCVMHADRTAAIDGGSRRQRHSAKARSIPCPPRPGLACSRDLVSVRRMDVQLAHLLP
jgi:hypothetical protein